MIFQVPRVCGGILGFMTVRKTEIVSEQFCQCKLALEREESQGAGEGRAKLSPSSSEPQTAHAQPGLCVAALGPGVNPSMSPEEFSFSSLCFGSGAC